MYWKLGCFMIIMVFNCYGVHLLRKRENKTEGLLCFIIALLWGIELDLSTYTSTLVDAVTKLHL